MRDACAFRNLKYYGAKALERIVCVLSGNKPTILSSDRIYEMM